MGPAICLLCMLCAGAVAAVEPVIPVQTWVVVLDDALQATADGAQRPLRLVLRRGPGGWWPVLGDAPDHNKAVASGVVEPGADGQHLQIHVLLPGDAWVPGGMGRYRMPSREGLPVSGAWTGSWCGRPMQGAATAQPVEPDVSGMPAARPGPVPSRLFSDGAALRTAVPTLTAAGAHPIALGLRVVAEGDPALHEQAWPAMAAAIAERNAGSGNERGYPWGERLRLLSLSWDLHGHALDREREGRLRRWLMEYGERALMQPWTISDRSYWAPDGRFAAQLRGAGALATLMLAGLAGPAPTPPSPPPSAVISLAAGGAFAGLPSQPVEAGRVATRWVMSGPHEPDWQPEQGLLTGRDPGAMELRPVPESAMVTGNGRRTGSIDLGLATGRVSDRAWVFASAMEVDRPLAGRWQMNAMNARVRTWISGVELADGAPIQLEPGRHAVVIRAAFGATPNAWDGLWICPHLIETGAEALAAAIAEGVEHHAVRLAIAAAATVQHADCRGADTRWIDHLSLARLHAAAWMDLCLGGGALASEGDAMLWGSAAPMLEFELFHRRLFGAGFADATGAQALLERVAALAVAGDRPAMPGFSIANGPISPAVAIRAWALVPSARQAMAVAALPPIDGATDPLAALILAAAPPDGLPRTPSLGWIAPRRGAVFFRNRHRDDQDIVVGITANQMLTTGHHQPEAGSWVLHGLGRSWMTADAGNNSRVRPLEPVITHGDGRGAPSAPGRLLAHRLDADGGGSALVDLSATLVTLAGDGYGCDPDLVDRLGRLIVARLPVVPEGVSHRRAWAVDWTEDGALILLRDRFSGAPGPGTWNLPIDEQAQVAIDGRSFDITADGATLSGALLGDGGALRCGPEDVEAKFYHRRRTTSITAVRFDVPTSADAVVLFQLRRAGAGPLIERQGDRVLVDGHHRFTLLADGAVDRHR